VPPTQPGGLTGFGAAFSALLDAAGLTPAKVRSLMKDDPELVSRSALYDWKKGQHLPEDNRPMLKVVRLCLDSARKRGAGLGRVPGDEDGWLRLLAAAKQARDSRIAHGRGTGGTRPLAPSSADAVV
jgi:hypothetical protein